MQPSLRRFCFGAFVGACVGVAVRVLGALVLNSALSSEQVAYLFTGSWVLPKFFLVFVVAFALIGTPVFLWARRQRRLSWSLFALCGGAVGYLTVFPLWFVPSWAAVHTASGVLAGIAAYAVMASGKRSVAL